MPGVRWHLRLSKYLDGISAVKYAPRRLTSTAIRGVNPVTHGTTELVKPLRATMRH